jgi:hypothetical protein
VKNWEPLESFLAGSSSLADFMFMDCSEAGGVRIFSYKHRNTRRYLNLDTRGNCYASSGAVGGNFMKIEPRDALAYVLS